VVTVYVAILAVGVLAIVLVLLGEKQSQKTSPVDLLNSLDIDENPSEPAKPEARSSTNFLNRLSMENDKTKTASEPVNPAKDALEQSAADFEMKLNNPTEPKHPENTI